MLRERSTDDYGAESEGGVRRLFTLGMYEFQDTIDGEERYHHYILERPAGGASGPTYEVDGETMYEFLARYLAGSFEMVQYHVDQSPTHNALLDVLEIATARARGGESEFSWEEFDNAETEVMDEEEPRDEP